MLPRFNAAIFDMDGLLIDSEPLWKEAEIEVFGQLGLQLTIEMCQQTEGFRLDEAVRFWFNKHPWKEAPLPEVEQAILKKVTELIVQRGTAMPGVYEVLDMLKNKGLKIGLASSSAMQLIEAVVHQLKITDYFEILWSAQYEDFGKPNPAVYLTTAKKLGVPPQKCLAFEDSYNGLLAAHTANMITVAVPSAVQYPQPRFDIASLKLHSLTEFDEKVLVRL